MTGLDEVRHWTLVLKGERPFTLNIERQGNRWKRAKVVARWRKHFWEEARDQLIPTLKAITVDVYPHYKDNRSIPDCAAAAIVSSAKAALDGVVDAGVIPDDNDKYVRRTTFHPAVIDGWVGIEIVIREAL